MAMKVIAPMVLLLTIFAYGCAETEPRECAELIRIIGCEESTSELLECAVRVRERSGRIVKKIMLVPKDK